MAEDSVERRLAAILAADAVGYSGMMGADAERTTAALKDHRHAFFDPTIAGHRPAWRRGERGGAAGRNGGSGESAYGPM